MKKLFVILIMLMMVMIVVVSARPATDPVPDDVTVTFNSNDLPTDRNGFGERKTIFTDIGDFFNRIFNTQEFSFTSESPDVSNTELFKEYYYDGGLKRGPIEVNGATGSYAEQVFACDKCEVDDYCQLLRYDPYTYDYVGQLFADYWFVSHSGDYIDLNDPQYYTADIEFRFGYKCYEPIAPPDYTYSCRDGGIYHEEVLVYRCATAIRSCAISEKQYIRIDPSDSQLSDDFCKALDTCYSCDGETQITDLRDGCYGDWDSSPVDCRIPTVKCYQCNGELLNSKTFDYACGIGWDENKPTCELPDVDVTCYKCSGGAVISDTFTNTCASTWVATKPTSCEGDTVSCYSCDPDNNGVVLSSLKTVCSVDESEKALTRAECTEGSGETVNQISEWYKDNSPQSYIITVAGLMIFIALGTTIYGRRKKVIQ